MSAKNQLELHLSAGSAAEASLQIATPFQLDQDALAAFTAGQNDPLDWPYWKEQFTDRRNQYLAMQRNQSASAIAAAKAAAATPTAKTTGN